MKRKKRIKNIFFLVLMSVFSVAIVCRSYNWTPGSAEHFFSYMVYPFLKLQINVMQAADETFSEWALFWSLQKEYKRIVVERDDLRAQLIALKSYVDTCEETKELQEFCKQYEHTSIRLVRILEKQYGSSGHFFLIEGGQKEGFKKDTAVVYKNCLVGKISEVFPWYSKVTLVTDPCCKVAAFCQKTKTQGIYYGAYSLQEGVLAHVGHLSTVQEGDEVFSSGQGLVFPKGFGIGTIASFSKNEGDMQYKIAVKPFVDFNSITYCFVFEKNMEKKDEDL